jgi:hypothetical protein
MNMGVISDNSEWNVWSIAKRWMFFKVFSDCISNEIDISSFENYKLYVKCCIEDKDLILTEVEKKRQYRVTGGISLRLDDNYFYTESNNTDSAKRMRKRYFILGKDLKSAEKKLFDYPALNNGKKNMICDYSQPSLVCENNNLNPDLMLDDWIPVFDVIARWEILSPNDSCIDYWLEGLWRLVVSGVVKIYDPSYDEYIDYFQLDPYGSPFGCSNGVGDFTSEVIKKEDMIMGEIEIGLRKLLPVQNFENKKDTTPKATRLKGVKTPEQKEFYNKSTLLMKSKYDGIKHVIIDNKYESYGEAGDVTVGEIENKCKERYLDINWTKNFNRIFQGAKKAGCVPISRKIV